MKSLVERLQNDVRVIEGLKACINCGVCTAICPAAAMCEYDPRQIIDTVQQGNEKEIESLLKGNTIWYCGECLSCKTRCPRGNTPGYIVQALRNLSMDTGYYMESNQGRKQLALRNTIGKHILEYGYCVYIDQIDTHRYPEQGPVWDWMRENRQKLLDRLGSHYKQKEKGGLRQIPDSSLNDLQRIFDETGASERFRKMEQLTAQKADESGLTVDEYLEHLENS
ncbi:MAG: 4Fe-4S dicluster domain-containing protein [Bacteroidales bacterium]